MATTKKVSSEYYRDDGSASGTNQYSNNQSSLGTGTSKTGTAIRGTLGYSGANKYMGQTPAYDYSSESPTNNAYNYNNTTQGKTGNVIATNPTTTNTEPSVGTVPATTNYGVSGTGTGVTAESPTYNGTYTQNITDTINAILNGGYSNLPTWNEQFNYGSYTNNYEDQINSALNSILNREAFSYDYTTDPLYQQYAKEYTRNGQRAMQDTLGQMAARTGGLASSYAGSAAQQSYNNYMSDLSAKIPELYQLAYSMYQDEGNRLNNNYNLLNNAEQSAYSRWQDGYNQYANEYDRRYNQYQDDYNNQFNLQKQTNSDNYDLLSLLQQLDADEYNKWVAANTPTYSGGSSSSNKTTTTTSNNPYVGNTTYESLLNMVRDAYTRPASTATTQTESAGLAGVTSGLASKDTKSAKTEYINNAVNDGLITENEAYQLGKQYGLV